jgi:hypothetical protein
VTALLLGAGAGLGVWLVVVGMFPPRKALAEALAEALAPPPTNPLASVPATVLGDEEAGWAARVGRPFTGLLAEFGLPRSRVRADLVVLGRDPGRHLAEQATSALAGLILPPATGALLAASGINIGWEVPLWAGLGLAVAGFWAPSLGVHADAKTRRADFRHALAAFLDLVVISLAGGAGVDGAMDAAAGVGTGWSAAQLRRALTAARLARRPPWETLARLGTELDIPELSELAASVSLAGSEGAKVRASLTAKAAGLRTHELTAAEADASAATERMSLPVVALFAGFLIFIGYPALAHVLTAL